MSKTAHTIISMETNDDKEKKSLLNTLSKRKKVLLQISAKVEMLKMDLDIIKREYDVRVGKLYTKDEQLDSEITRYKRIKELLEEGLSYEDAVKKITEAFYEEAKIFNMRFEEIAQEEKEVDKRKHVEKTEEQDIKKLWKKLLFQLHPDLTSDETEKRQREEIMRRINIAYSQNDYEALKSLENQHYTEDMATSSIETLSKTLVSIENSIIKLEIEYKNLRESEWFMWKKKSDYAKRKNIDLFKELEEKLLDEIARKITIVHTLRKEFDEKGYY